MKTANNDYEQFQWQPLGSFRPMMREEYSRIALAEVRKHLGEGVEIRLAEDPQVLLQHHLSSLVIGVFVDLDNDEEKMSIRVVGDDYPNEDEDGNQVYGRVAAFVEVAR